MDPCRSRLLITAGPTHEPLDAVRYIGNRSSGRLGLALAEAGAAAGWAVTLLLGPVGEVALPAGVTVRRFTSNRDLQSLLAEEFPRTNVLIMAAAVADYRPPRAATQKWPRTGESLTLELEPTPDLVAECVARKRPGQRVVGFALEEAAQLAARAPAKLARKGLDAIVANALETMGAGTIGATVYAADGRVVKPSGDAHLPKSDFARWLIGWIAESW